MAIGFPKPKRTVNEELLARVREQPCCACAAPAPSDPSHLVSRGAGGPDSAWNVAPHCRACHHIWHQEGPRKLVSKYPRFRRWLEEHGWDVDTNGAPSIDMSRRR